MKCNRFWDDTWNCLIAIGYKMKLASKAEFGQGSMLSAYKKYLGIIADHKFCISLRLLKDIQKIYSGIETRLCFSYLKGNMKKISLSSPVLN